MDKTTVFRDCKFLLVLPEQGGITTGLSLLVEGERIVALGSLAALEQRHGEKLRRAEVVDCANKIVMPGLVDGHNHLCNTHMNLARIIAIDYSNIAAHMMTTIHDPYGWMTDEALYDISLAAALCDIKQGATTVENSTIKPDVAYAAMRKSKVRGILAPQMATSFRLENDDLNWMEMLQRTEENIRNYHDPENGMSVVVHVHDAWDTIEEVMVRGMDLARRYKTKYVTHFWEFHDALHRSDELWAEEGGALNHYLNRGLVNDQCVLFHGSCLTEPDIDRLAPTGASIIHNPDINGTNCGNCAYIPYMLKKGVNVGLGSDYGSLDVKTAMKLMLFAHNIMPREHKGVAYDAPLRAATLGGARAYGLDHLIGTLEPGKRADIITFDLTHAANLLPMAASVIQYEPSILYFLFTRQAAGMETCETMINGELLRRNGVFLHIDEAEVVAKAARRCEQFIPDLKARLAKDGHFARRIHPDYQKDSDLDLAALLEL